MSRGYYKDSTTGEMKPIGVKVEDTLPIGFEGEIPDGTPIPEGWVEVPDGSVIVSPTEPQGNDRKKVWKQHSSKNILKCKQGISSPEASVTVTTDYTGEALNYINVSKSSSTSGNVFIEVSSFTFEYDTGNYILNGCPSGGSTNTYQLYFRDVTLNTDVSPRDEGSGAEVNLTKGHLYDLYMRINASATFTDKKFYPMLRLTTETDDTYEPYAEDKTYILNNNNVYEEFEPQNEVFDYELSNLPSHSGGSNSYVLQRTNNIINLSADMIWFNNITANTWVNIGNVPSNIAPKNVITVPTFFAIGTTGALDDYGKCSILTDGTVRMKSHSTLSGLYAIGFSATWFI